MAGSFYGEFLDTVGIELESSLHRDILVHNVYSPLVEKFGSKFDGIDFTRDASVEYNAYRINTRGNWIVSQHTDAGETLYETSRNSDSKQFGCEIVTKPLPFSTLEPLIFHTTTLLRASGDFLSDRTSTHYHVGFVNNLRILKNFLRIALMIDPVLFRIGGMGRRNRGWTNRFAYCRPLLHAPAVNYGKISASDIVNGNSRNKKYVKIINPMAALESDNLLSFWASFGVNYQPGGGSAKYWPSRYCGINFYSLPQHGTVEFRHFNKSLDPMEIISVGKFVRALTELATLLGKHDGIHFEVVPSNVEISVSDGSEIIYRMYSLCQQFEVDNLPNDAEMNCLMDLLKNSRMDSIPETPVLTHLRENHTIGSDLVNAGKLEIIDEVLRPKAIDIHNIGRISLFLNENSIEDKEN